MAPWHEFIPKSILVFKEGYTWAAFRKDLVAGLTVGVIALPLAMAFGITSGVTPEQGLITAIIAGFLISALGGSRVQIGGPTGAFVILVYDIVQQHGINGLILCTLMAGVLLIAMGCCKIGTWIKYIPHPLIIGFTTGIAVLIFSSQIKDFFGLDIKEMPADFIEKWTVIAKAFATLDLQILFVSGSTLLFILLIRRFIPRVPWGIAAIVLSTAIVLCFNLSVPTIQSVYGDLPRSLPLPKMPSLHIPPGMLQEYLFNALAIALLGAIESLLTAVIADGMIGSRHKSNCELVGQGIANVVSALFGGIPATGAIARTASNVKTGGRTPVAGMIHAIVLFLIVLCLSPIVSKIPLAALAAVLIMVAWNMSELPHFIRLLKAPLGDSAILLTAFLLTVFVDITFAVAFGMILASFLFMKRMSDVTKSASLFKEVETDSERPAHAQSHPFRGGLAELSILSGAAERPPLGEEESPSSQEGVLQPIRQLPNGVEIYEINGPFFFGTADVLQDLFSNFAKPPKVFILRLRFVPFIDASGINALQEFQDRCSKKGTKLLLSEVLGKVKEELRAFGMDRMSIYPRIEAAIARAEELVQESSSLLK